MQFKIFILVVFCSLFTPSFAGDEEVAQQLKSSVFIAVLEEEEPEVLKKFEKKPALLAEYKNNIKKTNDDFKMVLTKYWKLHTNILYKTMGEVNALKEAPKNKKDKTTYAYIRMDYFSYYKRTREESQAITSKEYTSDINYLRVYLLDGTEVTYTSLPNVLPTVPDLIYGVRHVYNTIVGMEFGKDLTALTEENCPQVRDKTLLVTQEQMGELEDKDFVKAYPFPYKIVTQAEIDKAVLTSDPKYAYIVSADQSDKVVMKMIVLTDSGKWVGYLVNMGRTTLTKTELKNLIKSCK